MSRRPVRGSRRGRRDPRERASPAAIVLLVLVSVGFVALLAAGYWWQTHDVAADSATLCPRAGPTALTVILVDATDGMSKVQKAAVQTKLDETIASLREYEQVQVYAIDPQVDLLKPNFVVCRPRSEKDTSEWTGNKGLARQQFEDIFQPRLRSVLSSAVERPASDASPIMEAVQQVVVGAFQKADAAAGHPLPKRLLIVSDMLENGAGGSHYRGVPDFEAFRRTEVYRSLRSHMEGIEVRILYLGRAEAAQIQGEPHARFWQAWFADQDARVSNIYWIEG